MRIVEKAKYIIMENEVHEITDGHRIERNSAEQKTRVNRVLRSIGDMIKRLDVSLTVRFES